MSLCSHAGRAGEGAPVSPSLHSPFPPEGWLLGWGESRICPGSISVPRGGVTVLPVPVPSRGEPSSGLLLPTARPPSAWASSLGCWLGSQLGPGFFLPRLRSAGGSQHLDLYGVGRAHLALSLSCVFPLVLCVRPLSVAHY